LTGGCTLKSQAKERIQQKKSTNTNSQTNKLYSYLIFFNQQSSAPKPIHHPSFSIPTIISPKTHSSSIIQHSNNPNVIPPNPNLLLNLQLKSRFTHPQTPPLSHQSNALFRSSLALGKLGQG
jgi:hypothetical protein